MKSKKELIRRAHIAADVFLIATAFVVAYFIKKFLLPGPLGGLAIAPNYYIVLFVTVISFVIASELFGLQRYIAKRSLLGVIKDAVLNMLVVMAITAVGFYVFKLEGISRLMMALFFSLAVLFLIGSKIVSLRLIEYLREKGLSVRNVLFVGSRERAREGIVLVREKLSNEFKVLGCLETDPAMVGKEAVHGVRIIGVVEDLEGILRKEVVDELVFAMPLKKIPQADAYIALAEHMGVQVRIFPDWQIHALTYRPAVASMMFEEFGGTPTLALVTTSQEHLGLIVKTVFEVAFSLSALLILSPLMLAVAAVIKIVSPGPVLFRQERLGLNGRKFMLFKFRTMRPDAEALLEELRAKNEADGPAFKIAKDPRIIPYVGKILRKTGLDELPQLLNIVKGEMSLIGPRPPLASEVNKYRNGYVRRLSMKPGLTCLWQCAPNRNQLSFSEWMKMDMEYIDNWSLMLDAKIFVRTVLAVLAGYGR